MRLVEELSQARPTRGVALSIGVFDGIHLGHRQILGRLKERARRQNLLSGVVTFRNHPRNVLVPGSDIKAIASLEERVAQIKAQGIDLVVPITFTRKVSMLSVQEFVSLLKEHLRMAYLITGPDFAMGHNREGDVPTLAVLGKAMGFKVEVVEAVVSDGLRVSSTAVRNALAAGDVSLVARFLGRPFALEGLVMPGAQRGKELGFPTANLMLPPEQAMPADGIYATWAYPHGRRHMAATSIGVRPTFGPGERTVETYILDFQGELYGETLRIELVKRLRDEMRFDSVAELTQRIAQDVEEARACLEALMSTEGRQAVRRRRT